MSVNVKTEEGLLMVAGKAEPVNTDFVFPQMFGASSDKSSDENFEIIKGALNYLNDNGGVMVIPADIEYGRSRYDSLRNYIVNPTNNFAVIDFSQGDTYGETSSDDGMQVRIISFTKNDDAGQHDGNGFIIDGEHSPYMFINNTAPKDEAKMRYAQMFFGNNGVVTWGLGQSANVPTQPTDDDSISNFAIVGNNVGTGSGLSNMFTINKKTGFFGWNIATATYKHQFNFQNKGQSAENVVAFTTSDAMDIKFLFKTKNSLRVVEFKNDKSINITNGDITRNVIKINPSGNTEFLNGVTGGNFSSANRPTGVAQGTMIFDTTLGKPIWWTSTRWVDANGTEV